MAEKATLLTSIPPVQKYEPVNKASLLKPADVSLPNKQPQALLEAVPVNEIEVLDSTERSIDNTTALAVESVPQPHNENATALQGALYISHVLVFCLAGFASIALLRNVTKKLVDRLAIVSRAIGVAAVLIALHGGLVTYLYANHLNAGAAIPLFAAATVWLLISPIIALSLNYLLSPETIPAKKSVIIDTCVYLLIYTGALVGLAASVSKDLSLVISLLSVFLFIIPIARSWGSLRIAKVRHPELSLQSSQILIYSLLFLPAMIPVCVIAKQFITNDASILLSLNCTLLGFVTVVSIATLITSSKRSNNEAEDDFKIAAEVGTNPVVNHAQPAGVGLNTSGSNGPQSPHGTAQAVINGPLPSQPQISRGSAPSVTASHMNDPVEVINAPKGIKAPAKPKRSF